MTAKELSENHRAFSRMDGQRKLVAYNFTPIDFKRFCEQLCREQRDICSRHVSGWPDKIKIESEIEDDVLNAPMPEL